jgi:hypothetical protein
MNPIRLSDALPAPFPVGEAAGARFVVLIDALPSNWLKQTYNDI